MSKKEIIQDGITTFLRTEKKTGHKTPESRKNNSVLRPGRPVRRDGPDELDGVKFTQTGLYVPEELWKKMQIIASREGITLKKNLYYALSSWVSLYEKRYGEVLLTSRESNFAEELMNSTEI